MNALPEPCDVTKALDTIHSEMRRLRCENSALRMKNNQQQACIDLLKQERDDLKLQHERLRAHYQRIEKPEAA